MVKKARIFVAGDASVAGKALVRYFKANCFDRVTGESEHKLDLTDQSSVYSFFENERPDYVFFTHARSGGILANMRYPADFIYDNLQAQNSVISCSHRFGVKKMLFFGSSCMYPAECPQPIKEEYISTGKVEATSEAYAISKIAGAKLCQSYARQYGSNFISMIPATIYGPHDDFDPEKAHVISALIRRFHEAKLNNDDSVTVWGTGEPLREFIYVDDCIDACLFLMDTYNGPEIINVGVGEDISVKDLALLIKDAVGFEGRILFDRSKADGVRKKLLDSSRMAALGWRPGVCLEEGIRRTCKWYKEATK